LEEKIVRFAVANE